MILRLPVRSLAEGAPYYYRLETVSTTGSTTLYGPVSVTHTAPTAVTLATFDTASASPLVVIAGMLGLLVARLVLGRR